MAERNSRRLEITRDFDSMERAFYWVRCWDLAADACKPRRAAFRTLEDAEKFAEFWQDNAENPEISGVENGIVNV